ncbi:MAG TPA: PCYCGC motif-containing (lipo)protein [Bacilli bacterium]|nr:PCYCGC motif-containing (lipo)protein [Bacilli bacterium]
MRFYSSVIVTSLLLTGCGLWGQSAPEKPQATSTTASQAAKAGESGTNMSMDNCPLAMTTSADGHVQLEDMEETTASLDVLPKFLAKLDPSVKEAYVAAAKAHDVMRWIPCYCGCGISEAHRSNLDCFIKTINKDGTVVWSDHGTRCTTCQNIAKITAKLQDEGKSATAIRQEIDKQFKEGYAEPTKTPRPE